MTYTALMKQYKRFLIFVTCFLLLGTTPAFAQCERYEHRPVVRINLMPVKTRYDHTRESSQFPAKPYANTMGLTVAKFEANATVKISEHSLGNNRYCTALEEINVEAGFAKMDVYLNKKFAVGTCQYNVIKDHEDYHVRVHQEALTHFKDKIEQAYEIAASKVKPIYSIGSQKNKAANQFLNDIQKEVSPLMQYVDKRIREENAKIDTPEAYLETSQKCANW